MPDAKTFVDGSSSFVMGADSYTMSTDLGEREYVMSQNCTARGGIAQTRPGTRSLFCLPDGRFQGQTMFTPSSGVPQLVSAVGGKIYVSSAPFTDYYQLTNLQFSPDSEFVAWASTLKSTEITNTGEIIPLNSPYSVLIIQDQVTRAGYWDGSMSGHLNPAPDPDVTDDTLLPGYNQTPIGLWMIWSGNRLWVSNENLIYASDIGDPLSFTEATYLNEGRAFVLSGPCTGMIEVPSEDSAAKGFIAFTASDGTLFQSYIQDRTTWLSTPLFQNTILPGSGCVAPRSLVTQYGLNWWFGPRGLTNMNAAYRQKLSSRIDYQDNEMFASKAYLGPYLGGICGGFYENYLLMSVPSGSVLNRHTWALDQSPMEGNVNSWAGIWTGWNPIEWCRGDVNGSERIFFGSVDYDGKNRVWEAMLPERTDNGCRITCYLQTREHAVGNLDEKRYEWTKFFLSQIYGTVDLNVYVASTKGGFQLQKDYHIEANEGQVFGNQEYSESGTPEYPLMVGNRVQTRTIRTPGDPQDDECNQCGVESKKGNMIDYAFSHLLVWTGQMGVRAYRMTMRQSPDRDAGDCEEAEVGPRTLNASGCSGLALFVDGDAFDSFVAHADGATELQNGSTAYIQRSAISPISEAVALSLARCAVEQTINQLAGVAISSGVFGTPGSTGGSTGGTESRRADCGPFSRTAGGGAAGGGAGGGGAGGGGAGGGIIVSPPPVAPVPFPGPVSVAFSKGSGPFSVPSNAFGAGIFFYKTQRAQGSNAVKFNLVPNNPNNFACSTSGPSPSSGTSQTAWSGEVVLNPLLNLLSGSIDVSLDLSGRLPAPFGSAPVGDQSIAIVGDQVEDAFNKVSLNNGHFATATYSESSRGSNFVFNYSTSPATIGYFTVGNMGAIYCSGLDMRVTLSNRMEIEDYGYTYPVTGVPARTQALGSFTPGGTPGAGGSNSGGGTFTGTRSKAEFGINLTTPTPFVTVAATYLVTPTVGSPYQTTITSLFSPVLGPNTLEVHYPWILDATVYMQSWQIFNTAEVADDYDDLDSPTVDFVSLSGTDSWPFPTVFFMAFPNADSWDNFLLSAPEAGASPQVTTITSGYSWVAAGVTFSRDPANCLDDFEAYSTGSVFVLAQGSGWSEVGLTFETNYLTAFDDFEAYPTGSIATLTPINLFGTGQFI